MIKSNRGVTVVTLTITVIIILIITGILIYNANDNVYIKRLTNMYNDISNLRDKVSEYYQEYGAVPTIGEVYNANLPSTVIGVNDTGEFYVIDLEKLEGLTLNYGQDYEKIKAGNYTNITDLKDVYIINDNSHNIFYVQGVEVKQDSTTEVYYTDEENIDVEAVSLIDIGKTDGSWNEEKGVNTPVIGENMELIKFDEESEDWVKDDTNLNYDYIEKETSGDNNESKWANAKVTIDGIESYFVWIPRYAYKITYDNQNDISQGGTIDIKFLKGTGEEAEDGTICKYADDSTLNTDTDYIIHPAFTDNVELGGWDEQLPGIWIAKFESSLVNKSDGNDINTSNETIGNIIVDENNNTDKAMAVQPNGWSWRCCTIGNMYDSARYYSNNLNSHMLKNSEWGAVAYLAHSKYGRNKTEITINNSASYYTGGGNYKNNTNQSTTGNIYGIYDLSGGCREWVASYFNGNNANTMYLNNSNGFAQIGKASDKFSTAYSSGTVEEGYKYGDATYETNYWSGEDIAFPNYAQPISNRGGRAQSIMSAGIFCYNAYDGGIHNDFSCRIALIVN